MPLGTTNFLVGIVAFFHGYIRVLRALRISNWKVVSSWRPYLQSLAVTCFLTRLLANPGFIPLGAESPIGEGFCRAGANRDRGKLR